MPCYHPLKGYRSKTVNPNGKRSIVFSVHQGYRDMPVEVPCGQCIGCRLERSRQWAIRCVHEASLQKHNSFITLTYAPENLPEDGSLKVDHYQKFMKRLRKHASWVRSPYHNDLLGNGTVRFFHCGEYGERFKRPHYHACLFGLDFKDRELVNERDGVKLWTSESLSRIWGKGFVTIGDVTFESAAYVARYITKKVTGEKALEHYNVIEKETGEILESRRAEYVTMSRRPGIGKGWFKEFRSDVFPGDFVVMRGSKMKPPKYYLGQYEIESPDEFVKLKGKRKKLAEENKENSTVERLEVRKKVQEYKYKQLKRGYENE